MNKKVLVIVSSPRKGGNSELLCDSFIKGARENGNEVEKLLLREKKIAPCIACEACLRNGGTCVQEDDMAGILDKLGLCRCNRAFHSGILLLGFGTTQSND